MSPTFDLSCYDQFDTHLKSLDPSVPTSHVSYKDNLKILVINFQSILNKKPDLLTLIGTEKPDILAGTETWLTPP